MKTHLFLHAAAFWLAAVALLPANLAGQGTAFTYQGLLTANGAPLNGPAELQFTLWNVASGGNRDHGIEAAARSAGKEFSEPEINSNALHL